jgi:hypothetical protein
MARILARLARRRQRAGRVVRADPPRRLPARAAACILSIAPYNRRQFFGWRSSGMLDWERPVRVFKSLKHGCYSIVQDGRLRASAREVRLREVEFRVREAGRQRMLRDGRRNLHAFAVGRLLDFVHPDETRTLGEMSGRPIHYDPYRFAHFIDLETLEPVKGADLVQLDERGVIYSMAA